MTRNQIIIGVAIVLFIFIAIYLYNSNNSTPLSVNKKSATFPLHYGQDGDEILQIQKVLNSRFGAKLKQDGKWGDEMENAMLKYFKFDSIDQPIYDKLINDSSYVDFLYQNYINTSVSRK